MSQITLTIQTTHPYPIYIDENALSKPLLANTVAALKKRVAIITDSNLLHSVGKQYQKYFKQHGIDAELLYFPAGEACKTRETKALIEDELFSKGFGRDSCLIALGGGVTTDLVGFIAATYMRGIPVIYIPTSLLAMVDASIGGKTGINTAYGKNLIGSFNEPHAVFMSTKLLQSLPSHEYIQGFAEVIKHALIDSPMHVEWLEANSQLLMQRDPKQLAQLIAKNCQVKQHIVEQDEKEQGIRQWLNYGHTIAHAIELIENYQVSHGVAVAIGMLVEAKIASLLGLLSASEWHRLQQLLQTYQLPLSTKAFQDKQAFLDALTLDKKAKAKIPYFVLLSKLGKVYQPEAGYSIAVPEAVLLESIDWAEKHLS